MTAKIVGKLPDGRDAIITDKETENKLKKLVFMADWCRELYMWTDDEAYKSLADSYQQELDSFYSKVKQLAKETSLKESGDN